MKPVTFHHCYTLDQFIGVINSPKVQHHREIERHIARLHQNDESFTLPGYCLVDQMPTDFLVDWQFGSSADEDGIVIPNWRERMTCSHCRLYNRQRSVLGFLLGRARLRRGPGRRLDLYITEQSGALYSMLTSRWQSMVSCIGSEYLGPNTPPGQVIEGIRHEDAERLSFRDESLDFILCNDVLEHIPRPRIAVNEFARALRPGGELILSTQLEAALKENRIRAKMTEKGIEHLLEPVYHFDPRSPEGSLVYTDFGWDLIDWMNTAGFKESSVVCYWSLEYGHLGILQFFIHGIKQ
jgi:hypothetical protein